MLIPILLENERVPVRLHANITRPYDVSATQARLEAAKLRMQARGVAKSAKELCGLLRKPDAVRLTSDEVQQKIIEAQSQLDD